MGQTLLTELYEPVRFLLGDNGSESAMFQYSDGSLAGALRTAISLNKLKGFCLTPDKLAVQPELSDPNKFALLIYHTVKLFVDPQPSGYHYKTRAVSETFGHWRDFIRTLESEIHHLENGAMFSGWMNYYTWLQGISGLPLGQLLTQLNMRSPIFGQQFSLDAFPMPIDEVIHY